MPDGPQQPAHLLSPAPIRRRAARAAVTSALSLGVLLGGTLVAPASAAPDLETRLEQAQAEAERLAGPARERVETHESARQQARQARQRVERLTQRIDRLERSVESVRTQMARQVLAGESGAAGSTAAPAAQLAPESTQLLASVLVVTDDSRGRAEQLAETTTEVEQLVERRAEVRGRLTERRERAERTEGPAARATRSLEQARSEVGQLQRRLEQERAEQAEREAAAEAEQAEQAEQSAGSSGGAVAYAMAQVGKSYVYGATGPNSFDCSGLTSAAWATEGVTIPRTSSAQYSFGTPVSESELRPGDLVFYYSPVSHVGIYVGGGRVVHALNPGSGVQITGLHDLPYQGARRPG